MSPKLLELADKLAAGARAKAAQEQKRIDAIIDARKLAEARPVPQQSK
jgi:hypothetical protein